MVTWTRYFLHAWGLYPYPPRDRSYCNSCETHSRSKNLTPNHMDSYNSPSTKPLYRGTQIVWYLVGILETFLAFRFFLKLFGANAAAGFTNFVYTVTQPLTAPFSTVFHMSRLEGSVFEWTTLLAMFVYGLVGWGIVKLLFMGKTVSTPEAAAKLNQEEK